MPSRVATPLVARGARLAREIRTAAILLLVQAAGLLVVAVSLLIRTASGGARSSVGGLSDVGLSLGGTLLLVVLAAALVRLSLAARTPVLVIEVLTVPIAYSLAVQSHQPQWGIPILISAVAILVLLFLPPAREQLQR